MDIGEIDLDKLNMRRVDTSLSKIAEAVREVERTGLPTMRFDEKFDAAEQKKTECVKRLAKAVNLAAAAREDMDFACQHFGWNDEIVSDMDEAVGRLGAAVAKILQVEPAMDEAAGEASEAQVKLSVVLAALAVWNDDDSSGADKED